MTTTGPHLTPEGISAAVEGLLAEPDQQAAQAHLADCVHCRSAQDELLGLRVLLRQAGSEPQPMPDSVVHRLSSALEAEAAGRSADTGVVSMGTARRSRHAAPSRRRRRLVPAFAAAAGVAAIAVGGTLGYQILADNGALDGSGSQTPTAGDAGSRGADSPDSGPMAVPGSEKYAIDGSPRLTSESFDAQVRAALQSSRDSEAGVAPKAGADPKAEGIAPAGAPDDDRCAEVAAVESGAGSILDVAQVSFDGDPALLAIARSDESGAVEAYVVTGCPKAGTVARHSTVTVER